MDLDFYKKEYEKDGYVLIKDFFSLEEANNIIKYADDLESWKEEKYKWMIYFENNSNKKARIENFINYHPNLKNILNDRLLPVINKIYGDNLVLFKDKLNWKYGGGGGFKAHQDQPAWDDFSPNRFVSLALFANNSTIDNGCLQFVSECHNNGIYDYDKEGSGEIKINEQHKLLWKHIESTPRDILIFDSFTPHRSDSNTTSNPRRIFYFTFNSESYGDLYSGYLKRKRELFPPDIERENKTINNKGNKYNLANPII